MISDEYPPVPPLLVGGAVIVGAPPLQLFPGQTVITLDKVVVVVKTVGQVE
jgi:hypothetical protein